MLNFSELVAQGNGWLFFPMAVFLGALHGLEPGHSKTMMTAFIVAIRGTVFQAMLLGISATVSHTAVIWVLAFIGLRYSSSIDVEGLEPYFQIATGLVVVGLALWMFYRLRQSQNKTRHHHEHDRAHDHPHDDDDHLEFGDAHEREHARELEKQLQQRDMTTGQIILFGLTGGLLPCPSAFAVLLLCLQLKKFALGFGLVFAFSVGLAVTLVSVGVVAALSIRHIGSRFQGFGEFAQKAPYLSSCLLIVIGLFVIGHGCLSLLR